MSLLTGWRKVWAAAALAAVAVSWLALSTDSPTASAHPLGNFTINRFAGIELSPTSVSLHYVIDMAEIPAFQERRAIDIDGDGELTAAEVEAYLDERAEALPEGLVLEVDGERVDLLPTERALAFPAGQGGLETLRLSVDFVGELPEGRSAHFRDETYGSRIGWREVVVHAGDGVRLRESTALSESVSDELRAYPEDGLANPLSISEVSFGFEVGGAAGVSDTAPAVPAPEDAARAATGSPDAPLARYADLIARERLTLGVALIALLAAAGFGALHALSPGHGKTIVAAYLVGSKGTWRHALLLALTVTVTHTSSVYAIGFVTLYLSEFILPEDLYPWLTVGSGALILGLGGTLLAGRLRSSGLLSDARSWLRARAAVASRPRLVWAEATAASHVHETPRHAGHGSWRDHGHERHDVGSGHSHAPLAGGGDALSLRGLLGLGVFGGLLPCPSAIVVMLSAIALHRVAFGLLLIVAFSVGLAGVLTAIGFVLVYAGGLPRRLPLVRRLAGRLAEGGAGMLAVRLFPVGSAAAVVAAGLVVAVRGLSQQGLI